MISLDSGETKLFSRYWGREDLIDDEDFWRDVYDYYSQDIGDAPLPLTYNPNTVRMVLEMLDCRPGVCSKCCHYPNTQLNLNDIRRIVENTRYTQEDLGKLIVTKENKLSLNCKNGCPFLKKHRCTIHEYRPDACFFFPISGKAAMIGDEKVKQMQIRVICKPALAVARKIITEAISKGKSLLLPDLTIIPKEITKPHIPDPQQR